MNSTAKLLKFTEKLDANLSGSQIASILDQLLYEAVTPVVMATDFFNPPLVDLLLFASSNTRRKYSFHDKQQFVDLLFSCLMTNKRQTKLDLLKSCRIERTVIFSTLSDFYKKTEQYCAIYAQLVSQFGALQQSEIYKKLREIEQQVFVVKSKNQNIGSLYNVIQNSKQAFDLAQDFKAQIVEKYIRLAHNESKKASSNTKLFIDQEELFKNLILSISKAIDKYDPEKGALTSYVRWWFMDGINQATNSHEYGIAYQVPTSRRKNMLKEQSNFYVNIDSCVNRENPNTLDVEQEMIQDQDEAQLRRMLRYADLSGMAMLMLNIPYVLDNNEIAMLKNTLETC